MVSQAEMRVVDPVCGMTVEPAQAIASETSGGQVYYFCSEACHRRFLASPNAFASAPTRAEGSAVLRSDAGGSVGGQPGGKQAMVGMAAVLGTIAAGGLLAVYFGLLTALSGWEFTLDQFRAYWGFIVALAAGFGVQVGLFTHLRRAAHAARSGRVVAVTGTTSGAAMVSCCAHYLVNLLPVLGATGLVSLVGAYQVELFWFGLLANLAGIAYMASRLRAIA